MNFLFVRTAHSEDILDFFCHFLREINFENVRSSKSAIFAASEAQNFIFGRFQNLNSEPQKCQKQSMELLESYKLISRKI